LSFENDQDEGVDKLSRALTKRGDEPVGMFLLSLMLHIKGNNVEAINIAEKARYMVAGSNFFVGLPYRLKHPEGFDAWVPQELGFSESEPVINEVITAPAAELDELIVVLSDVENTRIKLVDKPIENDAYFYEGEGEVDDIYTETLAKIYFNQNELERSLKIYKRLVEMHPEKEALYNRIILKIEKKL
jgi:tetratricopeptide (TPR) repeat protein